MKITQKYFLKFDPSSTNNTYGKSNTPSFYIRNNFIYVQAMGYYGAMPSYYTERQFDNSYLIILTISGKGYLKYKQNEYELSKNDVFFINCADYQLYKNASSEIWEFRFLHLNGNNCSQYFNYFMTLNGSPVISFNDTTELANILNELEKTIEQINTKVEIHNSCLLIRIMTNILLSGCNISENEHHLQIPEYMKNIIDYINEHYNEPVTLEILSHKYGVSRFHLSREFKKHTGISFKEYIINLRITHAKELFRNTDLTISEISKQIGIENVTHFINLFKSRENCTPNNYRKLITY